MAPTCQASGSSSQPVRGVPRPLRDKDVPWPSRSTFRESARSVQHAQCHLLADGGVCRSRGRDARATQRTLRTTLETEGRHEVPLAEGDSVVIIAGLLGLVVLARRFDDLDRTLGHPLRCSARGDCVRCPARRFLAVRRPAPAPDPDCRRGAASRSLIARMRLGHC